MQLKNEAKNGFAVLADCANQHLKVSFPILQEKLIDELETMAEESIAPDERHLEVCYPVVNFAQQRSFSEQIELSPFENQHGEYKIRVFVPNTDSNDHLYAASNEDFQGDFVIDDGLFMSDSFIRSEPCQHAFLSCDLYQTSSKLYPSFDTFLECSQNMNTLPTSSQDYCLIHKESRTAGFEMSTSEIPAIRRRSAFDMSLVTEAWQVPFRKKVKRF